jgi:hypothetical protein
LESQCKQLSPELRLHSIVMHGACRGGVVRSETPVFTPRRGFLGSHKTEEEAGHGSGCRLPVPERTGGTDQLRRGLEFHEWKLL